MIVSDSPKSETGATSHASFGPADTPLSPPPYTPTITFGNSYHQVQSPPPASFCPASSVQPNLPPRCNYFIDRKTFSGVSGTWHVDNALEIPEHLLLPITDFDGYWNREAQRTRKSRAAEVRRLQERISDSKGNLPFPSVEIRPNLMLATSNGAISGDIHVMSSDGLLRQTTLAAQGFNGSINLKIHAPPGQFLRVFASTTNGSIDIKIPSSFEGAVIMSTTWGAVKLSEAIKAKVTTFSSTSNTLRGFVGNWQAREFGVDLVGESSPPNQRDPFATWAGPFVEISSTNGSISLSHTEEGSISAYIAQFTKAIQGLKDNWFGAGEQNLSAVSGRSPRPPTDQVPGARPAHSINPK